MRWEFTIAVFARQMVGTTSAIFFLRNK